jgi:plastocyanin
MSLKSIILAAVLMASGVASVSTAAPPKVHEITIDRVAFADAPTGIKVGDVIEWFNKDIVDHTATAKNGAWDVTIPTKKKTRVVMKTAGIVDYYCRFHPNMTGQLTVKK